MLTETELKEIKQHLEASQNPLFLFDNDADGLCSFVILRRALDRGKGIPIKTYPELTDQYLRKIDELKPDAIFILDKAEVSTEFIDRVQELNLPIIWIDHHQSRTPKEYQDKTNYYNTYPSSEPTTYIAQKVFNRKQDLFLALIGCVADIYIPDFAKGVEEQYPEMFDSNQTAFEAFHTTQIGKFAQMLNFGLMNTTTNVVKLMKYLCKINHPHEILEENFYTKEFHKRVQELQQELDKLKNKAKEKAKETDKLILFTYSGPTSMSSILSNQLLFENPNKLIVVAHQKPEKINISIRGKNALNITKQLLEKIEGATGGGHEEATGAMIPATELEKFKEVLTTLAK